MKFKNKSSIPIFLIVLSILSQTGVAFSSWVIINNKSDNFSGCSELGTIQIGIPGISISLENGLVIGKYFYFVNNESSFEGELSYSFNITPSLLPKDLVTTNQNGGFDFKLIGNLSLENCTIFNESETNPYLLNVKLKAIEIDSLDYKGNDLIFDLNFSTASQGNDIEEFSLSFCFSNKLILEFRDELLKNSFNLEISI